MRHGKKINHLSRQAPHRQAMLANMASSLVKHKRIKTTLAKAKALQRYIEPLLTKGKADTTHSRRVVFSYLKDKEAISILFGEIAQKIADRPGGYTRIIKTGYRLGDAAEMALIELVDYNELYTTAKPEKKTRRSRRGAKTSDDVKSKDTPATKAKEVPLDVEETAIEEKVVTETIDDGEISQITTQEIDIPQDDQSPDKEDAEEKGEEQA